MLKREMNYILGPASGRLLGTPHRGLKIYSSDTCRAERWGFLRHRELPGGPSRTRCLSCLHLWPLPPHSAPLSTSELCAPLSWDWLRSRVTFQRNQNSLSAVSPGFVTGSGGLSPSVTSLFLAAFEGEE